MWDFYKCILYISLQLFFVGTVESTIPPPSPPPCFAAPFLRGTTIDAAAGVAAPVAQASSGFCQVHPAKPVHCWGLIGGGNRNWVLYIMNVSKERHCIMYTYIMYRSNRVMIVDIVHPKKKEGNTTNQQIKHVIHVVPSAPVGWAQEWPPAVAVRGIRLATGTPRFRCPRWSRQRCAPHGKECFGESCSWISYNLHTNYIHDAYMCWSIYIYI